MSKTKPAQNSPAKNLKGHFKTLNISNDEIHATHGSI